MVDVSNKIAVLRKKRNFISNVLGRFSEREKYVAI